MKKYIPSFITSLNLICGFIAILLNDIFWSPLLIGLGAIMDVFDGLSAKLLNAVSEFGKQLDSLADLMTFGIAPAYLYYQHILPHNTVGLISASFLPVFGAYRLAKFNVSTNQAESFKGLPIPANGIFFIAIVFLLNFKGYNWLLNIFKIETISIVLPVLFAILMACNIIMFSFKKFSGLVNAQTIFFLLLIITAVFFKWAAIPLAVIIYILLSIILCNLNNKSKC